METYVLLAWKFTLCFTLSYPNLILSPYSFLPLSIVMLWKRRLKDSFIFCSPSLCRALGLTYKPRRSFLKASRVCPLTTQFTCSDLVFACRGWDTVVSNVKYAYSVSSSGWSSSLRVSYRSKGYTFSIRICSLGLREVAKVRKAMLLVYF
jgi:hypothetical protein